MASVLYGRDQSSTHRRGATFVLAVTAPPLGSNDGVTGMLTMQYLSSGTLLKRTKVCGNPRCHCATDPAERHGPYYEWSHMKAGKLRHHTLTPEQAGLMRLAIANHRKVKQLLRAWEVQTQRLIELNAPE
jgi:hypothetical protein